ncbi:50S ribosomal protein L9 [Desulfovibrio subterraneus]|uniref:Large ribosomal subunit protein bL9 n=1 Tax=Desulfovibrio subterraneus TaxID=2718620 RepID=A0A7J0BLF0_9BACT|nr:50S ribosomal protein L9 [Desulfovibrio subterraneus]GFM34490.1 50S ribosomal protein L9 [Desulfovibrio subterraneus]
MKVILRADVENLGVLGDVVEVKAGYGRNFLLPKGLAMMATAGNLKAFELERKKLHEKMEAVRGAAQALASKLEKVELVLQVRVGENDKLYGSVTATNIAEALAAQGIDIDRRRILLDAPIRVLGEYPVRVRLHAGVISEVLVKVAPEGRLVEEEAPAVANDAAEESAE